MCVWPLLPTLHRPAAWLALQGDALSLAGALNNWPSSCPPVCLPAAGGEGAARGSRGQGRRLAAVHGGAACAGISCRGGSCCSRGCTAAGHRSRAGSSAAAGGSQRGERICGSPAAVCRGGRGQGQADSGGAAEGGAGGASCCLAPAACCLLPALLSPSLLSSPPAPGYIHHATLRFLPLHPLPCPASPHACLMEVAPHRYP